MKRAKLRKILIGATALVWLGAFYASFERFQLGAKAPFTISLLTEPRSVRISIDDEPYNGNDAYVDTPQTLNLSAGQHKLKIERSGYIDHLIQVEGEVDDHYKIEDVVLQRQNQVGLASVVIESYPEQTPLYFQIDNGLLKGETPYESEADLVVGVEHILSLYPSWPSKEHRRRCRFAIQETNSRYPIKILLGKNGGIRFQGCERIGAKKKAP